MIAREPLIFPPPSSFSAGTVPTPKRRRIRGACSGIISSTVLYGIPFSASALRTASEGCDDGTM